MQDTDTAQNPLSLEDLSLVKHRSVTGVLALVSRTFFVQIVAFAATFILSVYLTPSIYGTFFLVSAVINFLTYFSDIGLAAALIQKKQAPTNIDLATTFSVQQLLVVSLVSVLFLSTPMLRRVYHLTDPAVFLLWALAISFFISSLKTIPTILLERNLQFGKLVIPQILETLAFNLVAVFLAIKGFGVTTFTLAVLIRAVVGLVAIYIVSPWRPTLGFSKASLVSLLRFGVPYQANTFLAVIKDDGVTLVLGTLIGQQGLGFIGWATKWAFLPLRFFMDNVTKVAFPAFSRLQSHPDQLRLGLEKTLYFLCLVSLPAFVGIGLLASPMVHLLPRYLKWEPAILPLYLYLTNAFWATLTTPMTNALVAVGRIKLTFKYMLMWTGLTWTLTPLLAKFYGTNGVAFAAALVSASSVIVLFQMTRDYRLNLISAVMPPLAATGVMAIVLLLARGWFDQMSFLPVFILLGGLVYTTSIMLITKGKVFADIRSVIMKQKLT